MITRSSSLQLSSQTKDSSGVMAIWQGWLNPLDAAIARQQVAFDENALIADLKACAASSHSAATFRQQALVRLKSALHDMRQTLQSDLIKTQDGARYVGAHAHSMDRLMVTIMKYLVTPALQFDDNNLPSDDTASGRWALMATGGYGRGEMAPYSDVDLLFLQERASDPISQIQIEYMLYILWDLGLKIGHATRSVRQNITAAKQDITIMTSLLETRFICGDKQLSEQFEQAINGLIARANPIAFVHDKLTERDLRHHQHGATRYVVEPQIKEGKGGLRDLHTLFWIAKFAYRSADIMAIFEKGIIRISEARAFAASQRFLWTVRCFLHLRSGRGDDMLAFDAQIDIAPQMGFVSKGGMRDVERFMKRYHLAARHVGNLTRIFCAAIEDEFDTKSSRSLSRLFHDGLSRFSMSVAPFILKNGRLHLPPEMFFHQDPIRLIQIFYYAQKYNLDIHPDSFKRLTRGTNRLSHADLWKPDFHEYFLDILGHKQSPERVLRLMNESGFLSKYMPDFGRIVGMMQFDMYHSYTVDEHTLKAVGIMNGIEQGLIKKQAPLACELFSKISSRRALYVAILLHDIAKGRGGDHSVLGAEVAAKLCPELGLDEEETETVIWLIYHHLLMSKIAFRYDLNDPKTITDFVADVQSPERLKLLLILTVADIRAVGPDIWNGWKASLMRDLYWRAEAVIGGAAPAEVAHMAAGEALFQVREKLISDHGWDEASFEEFASQFYPSYWTSFATSRLVKQALLVQGFARDDNPLSIHFDKDETHNTTIMTVMAQDHPGLFSRIAGAVALSHLTIVNARINTRKDGTIIDTFRLQDENRQAVHDEDSLSALRDKIAKALRGEMNLHMALEKKWHSQPARLRALSVPPRVIVTNKRSKTHTVIEVNGRDRPGLLYQLTYHIAQMGLQINSASVSTYGEKAVDVFYVRDIFGLQIPTDTVADKIKSKLMVLLDDSNET
ncbi:MAG: [protein-PII] uridylyltransferase [Candidatus Puniceispirillaceae bacterium]